MKIDSKICIAAALMLSTVAPAFAWHHHFHDHDFRRAERWESRANRNFYRGNVWRGERDQWRANRALRHAYRGGYHRGHWY